MESYDRYVGMLFDGRYRIDKVVGIGGMAVVFQATDTVSNRTVAVKMLKETNDEQSIKRFISESKAISMLSHPNIVAIYDVSIKEHLKYIVMEYIDGITLKSYLNRRGTISFKETVSFSSQVLQALEYAHSKKIIHRDIKPQNIMLLRDGTIKLTDFGIAKLPNAETLTMTDKAIGTVYYISPEQASGKTIDCRSDLYSLGVMMYEMATGSLPFNGDSPVTIALMQVSTQPKKPREVNPQIPIGLEQIILGAMEKSPEKRFHSAHTMLYYLRQLEAKPDIVFTAKNNTTTQQIPQVHPKTYRSNTASKQSKNYTNKRRTEKKSEKRSNRSHSMLPVIMGVTGAFFIVMLVSGIIVLRNYLTNTSANDPKTITVGQYIGEFYTDEFASELKSLGYYDIELVNLYDNSAQKDEIIAQEPTEGEKRKVIPGIQKCSLKLTVCRGEKSVTLEDYVLEEYRIVEADLRNNYSLIPSKAEEYSDTIPMGRVIRTEPEAGESLKTGDSVKIVVSLGQNINYVTVPNFIGLSESAASSLLSASSLALGEVEYAYTGTEEYPDKYEKGKVISQSKNANASVAANSTEISFVVSLGIYGEEETEIETAEE